MDASAVIICPHGLNGIIGWLLDGKNTVGEIRGRNKCQNALEFSPVPLESIMLLLN